MPVGTAPCDAGGGGGGLPQNVYMDEFGNTIFGADNIAAFPTDRAGTEMVDVYVDSASTVSFPPAGVPVNGLRVEGGAVVDLDGITSGAITDFTVLGATSAVLLSGPNITINAVRVEDGDITGSATGTGTLLIEKTTISTGGYILFDDPVGTGGSIVVRGCVLSAAASIAMYLSSDYTGTALVENSMFSGDTFCEWYTAAMNFAVRDTQVLGDAYINGSGAGALDIRQCHLTGGSFINSGAADLTVFTTQMSNNSFVNATGTTATTITNSQLVNQSSIRPNATTAAAQAGQIRMANGAILRLTGDSQLASCIFENACDITTAGHDGTFVHVTRAISKTFTGANTSTYATANLNTLV